MEISISILAVGALVFLAHLFSALFEKTRIPDVLPLLFIGLIAGPILHIIPSEAFGAIGPVFTVIALIVILFYTGLEMDLSDLRNSAATGLTVTAINFAASVAAIAIIAAMLLDYSLLEAMALGAIVGGTSSAVVIPITARLALDGEVKTALVLESTLSDVLCIVFALAFIKAAQIHSINPGLIVGQIVSSFVLATVIGILAALFWSAILGKVRLFENSTFTTPAFVFVVYGIAEMLGYSGAIAAFAFGILLGNVHSINVPSLARNLPAKLIRLNTLEKAFFSELVFLLKTFFFVYIGLMLSFKSIPNFLIGFGLSAVLYGARFPVVRLSFRKQLSAYDRFIAVTMIPKGLAAAVLASLVAASGLPSGAQTQDIVYSVVLCTITISSLLAFIADKKFKPDTTGSPPGPAGTYT